MLTRYEQLRIAGSNVSGNPFVRWPGTPAPPAPAVVKMRVTCPLFKLAGDAVEVGQLIVVSASDAQTLAQRRWAEYVR